MKLPMGFFREMESLTGIRSRYLSRYVNTELRPRPERAILLEQVTTELGFRVPKELWIFGTKEEIKAALMKGRGYEGS